MARTGTPLVSLVPARIGRVIALLAAALLCVALAPATAYAADTINSYRDLDYACIYGGEYVLGADIVYTELEEPDDPGSPLRYPRVSGKTVSIDLNGHTVDANGAGYGIEVSSGSLTIRDGKGGGKLTGADTYAICANGVGNGSFVLESGEISGNVNGVFATNGGSVTIKGGSIADNDWFGLVIYRGSALTLSGSPEITGNGDAGIRLRLSGPLTIGGAFAPASPVSVEWNPANGVYTGTFTSGYSDYCTGDPSKYFASARSGYMVAMDGEEAAIVKSYTVTFVDEDGSELSKVECPVGTKAADIAKPDPVKPADAQYTYPFAGWSPEIADVTEDATYTATYTATPREKGTLTFDLGGGTLDGQTGSITIVANVGDTIELPGAPAKDGYTFKFWKGSEYAAGAEYTVEGDHAFTAEWEQNASSDEKSDSGKSDSNAKSKIPATGDDMGKVVIPLSVVAGVALIVLIGAAIKRREA